MLNAMNVSYLQYWISESRLNNGFQETQMCRFKVVMPVKQGRMDRIA